MARHRVKSVYCGNCNCTFTAGDNYCPNCGQENHSPNQPIKHLLMELVESLFHFDTKFIHSFSSLLLYPGKMSKEFLANKRARFVPPVRLYIFVSVIVFVLLKLASHDKHEEEIKKSNVTTSLIEQESDTEENASDTSNQKYNIDIGVGDANVFNLKISKETRNGILRNPSINIDSFIISQGSTPTVLNRFLFRKAIYILNHQDEFVSSFRNHWFSYLSYSMFFILPIFAFFLKLIYWKQKKYYYEYLIVALHLQTAIFCLVSIIILINKIFNPDFMITLLIVLSFLYFYKTFRVLYHQSRIKTLFKTGLIHFTYLGLIIFGISLAAVAGILL